MNCTLRRPYGFTLIELAIVLFIVGLLLTGLLVPLSTQIGQRDRQTTERQLDDIREALLGFAVVNGYLPCPTTTTDPASPNYGVADTTCTAVPTAEGYLPWKTLGVRAYDAWGRERTATTDAWTGYFRYRIDRNFANNALPIRLTTTFADNLVVKDSAGISLTSSSEPPVAIVYSTGPNAIADGQNATFDATYQGGPPTANFDDITFWISRPVLYNRLVAAGRIP